MVYAGKNSYVYFKEEDAWAYDEVIGANAAGNYHLPFNPLLKFNPPFVNYKEESITFFSDLDPSVIFTERKEGEESENEAIYMDPVLLLHIFEHVVEPASWSQTGTNTITADFTTQSFINSLAVNMHLHDQSAAAKHLNRTWKGVKVTQYGWQVETGKLLKEKWKWKAVHVDAETQAPDMDAGLDDGAFNRSGVDGGFAGWDSQGPFHASDITLTKGGSALAGLQIQKFEFTIDLPEEYVFIYSSYEPQVRHHGIRGYTLKVEGLMSDYDQITEIEKTYDNKTKDTLQVKLATDYYLQFTNSYVSKFTYDGIPEAGQPCKFEMEIKGGASTALSFSWKNTAGPSLDIRTYIN